MPCTHARSVHCAAQDPAPGTYSVKVGGPWRALLDAAAGTCLQQPIPIFRVPAEAVSQRRRATGERSDF